MDFFKHGKGKRIAVLIIILACLLCAVIIIPNVIMICSANRYILKPEETEDLNADCALVLGAAVWGEDTLSHVLEDRVLQGIDLYERGSVKKILMSGDHGKEDYDEVNAMKSYATEKGVPADDIFMDHAGFSTYESMYRARDVFKTDKIIICTQQYHLYRAVYVARALGIEAYGVPSNPRPYRSAIRNNAREILARVKDFGTSIIKPEPTYLGEAIPINGSGALTDDKT